jgi:hypothetical protein
VREQVYLDIDGCICFLKLELNILSNDVFVNWKGSIELVFKQLQVETIHKLTELIVENASVHRQSEMLFLVDPHDKAVDPSKVALSYVD